VGFFGGFFCFVGFFCVGLFGVFGVCFFCCVLCFWGLWVCCVVVFGWCLGVCGFLLGGGLGWCFFFVGLLLLLLFFFFLVGCSGSCLVLVLFLSFPTLFSCSLIYLSDFCHVNDLKVLMASPFLGSSVVRWPFDYTFSRSLEVCSSLSCFPITSFVAVIHFLDTW